MHYLTVYCRFRNEREWLREWLEYYRLLGVDHFILIDHLSTDNPLEYLQPYIDRKLVTYYRWEQELEKPHSRTFVKMGNKALSLAKNKTKWLAVFDSDEFLVPVDANRSLRSILQEYESYPAVVVNWQMFGTNRVEKIPAGKLLIETLTARAPRDYGQNKHIKTILQPAKTLSLGIHDAKYPMYSRAVNTDHQGVDGAFNDPILTDRLRLHHYFLRDRTFMREVKLARRAKFGHNAEVVWRWEEEMNVEQDKIMSRYVAPLRARVFPPEWRSYLQKNPDLQKAGIDNEAAAHWHWFTHGMFEKRG